MNYFLEARAQRRTSCDDKIGIILLSPCISYTTNLLIIFYEEQFSLHLDLPDCNVFGSACTDNSSFRCSPSAYLMQISWIFVCRASFRQVTASIDALQLLLLHAYYFCASTCQRTIFHVRSMKLSSDARLSLPERPTL